MLARVDFRPLTMPAMTYVERDGIWAIVARAEEAEAVTVWDVRIVHQTYLWEREPRPKVPIRARAARWANVLALSLIVSACAATGPSAAESLIEEVESQLPAASALSADEIVAEVQANAESECIADAGVDELFCNEVDFDAITFEDGLLTVPTALEATAVADA